MDYRPLSLWSSTLATCHCIVHTYAVATICLNHMNALSPLISEEDIYKYPKLWLKSSFFFFYLPNYSGLFKPPNLLYSLPNLLCSLLKLLHNLSKLFLLPTNVAQSSKRVAQSLRYSMLMRASLILLLTGQQPIPRSLSGQLSPHLLPH